MLICLGLEEMGAIVIAVDRDVSNVPESTRVKPYQLDVTDWNGLKRLYEEISEKYGRIDVVCNNAGIFERMFAVSESYAGLTVQRRGHSFGWTLMLRVILLLR